MKITIDIFNQQSLNNALIALEKICLNIESACNEITERLAKIGRQVVEAEYLSAMDEKPFEVTIEQTNKGYMVIATGENVVFLEFGTGVLTEDYEGRESELPILIQPGSWSQTEGRGNFVVGSHEYWYHNRKKYSGTIATKGFYFAKQEMKEQAKIIAKEVFHKWLM